MSEPDVPDLVLVSGPEQILAQRAVNTVLTTLRAHDPELDVVRIAATDYEPGALGVHASPSLFGGWTALVVEDFDEADDALVEDAHSLAQAPPDGVTLIVRHKSGNRGKRVLDVFKKSGRVITAPAVKSDRDKIAFVQQEFKDARRQIEEPAATALVQAVGKDVAELATACAQLVRDTTGKVRTTDVETYYGDKVETTGFKVADAALRGDTAEALRLLRHALAGGLDPVPIIAVLAMQLRQVGKVASAGRASSGNLARDLGMAPWQVDQARRTAQGWDGPRLGRAIQAVAAADVEVKGGVRTGTAVARDPEYAVEMAVLAVCRARRG
ncbi:DNA polymerase III subunit delta [Ornithinimicrobium murale]|uniref:DNA polymerase III subunit delta n=1 Tax=Ornithinimicrobium murale TaxID=1050153 RepID=UPI000E0DF06B|nr:DNA polymerase III subunit delta [Ornithinimicrobium murale]